MIYYRKTLSSSGPKLTAVQFVFSLERLAKNKSQFCSAKPIAVSLPIPDVEPVIRTFINCLYNI